MNVYDFDGTIYDGDSSIDFFLYALKKKPSIIRFLPRQAWGFLRYKAGKTGKTAFKESLFSFLQGIDAGLMVETFWDGHEKKIMDWYKKQQGENDVIISASPEFLLRPVCGRLGIKYLIASLVDAHTGKFQGENCRGAEKVSRFQLAFGSRPVSRFYSDSRSDQPFADMAEQAFLVKKGKISVWR